MTKSNKNAVASSDFTAFEDSVYSYSKHGPRRKQAARGDPLRDTLETLYSEHRYIASLLDAMEEQEQRMRPGKIPDYNLLLDILDYLTNYPDQFHHPREDLLFAHMLETDSSFQSKLDRLHREHETLRHYNAELFNELTRIADGRPVDQASLRKSIVRYLAGYRKHMDYESRQVFPCASGELNQSDVRKLEEKTRFSNDPVFGTEVQYKYRRLGRRLEARVGMVSEQLIAREMSGIETFIGNLTGIVETMGKVKAAIGDQGREARRENLDTIKDHARWRDGPNLLLLPLALARNHERQVKQGVGQLRGIIGRRGKVESRNQSIPSAEGK